MRSVLAHQFGRIVRLAAIVLCCVSLGGPAVEAEDGGFGGFLQHLFGGDAPRPAEPAMPPPQAHRPKKRVRGFRPAPTPRRPGTPGGAPVEPTFFIDVLGDSLGG